MLRKLVVPFALVFILSLFPGAASAEVVLPESGRLVGPLDPGLSELGDEFSNFGPAFGARAPIGQSKLSGWMEIVFGEPVDGLVPFTFDVRARGTLEIVEFDSGFRYAQEYPNLGVLPSVPSGGVLDLATGEIVEFGFASLWRFGTIGDVTRLNRMPFIFSPTFPATAPVAAPPGFLFSNASFEIDADGRIQGFNFFGTSLIPIGILAGSGVFPPFSFGPNGEFYMANPASCDDSVGVCPTDFDNPDGFPLPPDAFFRPHVFLVSSRLQDADAWTAPCLKVARGDAGAAAVDGRFYRFGGTRTGRPTARVDVYDATTDKWRLRKRLPIAVRGAQVVEVGGLIYVIGGRSERAASARSEVQIYDPETNTWSFGPTLLAPTTDGAAAQLGSGLVYLAGGRTNTFSGDLDLGDTLQIFDPGSGAWFLGPQIPEVVERAAVVAVGSDLWLIGGAGFGGETDRVWIYDEGVFAWSEGPRLPGTLVDASAVYHDGEIVVMGGRHTRGGPALQQRLIIHPDVGVWRELPDLALPVADASAAEIDGEIMLVGGFIKSPLETVFDAGDGSAVAAVQHGAAGRPVRICTDEPFFTADRVLNASSLTVGPLTLARGTRGVVAGWNLAKETATADPTASAPTELGGVSLTIGGLAAPLLAVSPNRIDFQVPGETPVDFAEFTLHSGENKVSVDIFIVPEAPGIFVESYGEMFDRSYLHLNSALACNGNGSYNYASNTASNGEVITLQVSGLGPTDPPMADGERAGAALPLALLPTVTIDGIDAEVLEATALPGLVGVFGVRVVVPDGARSGNRIPVMVSVGHVGSNVAVIAIGDTVSETPVPCLPPSPV